MVLIILHGRSLGALEVNKHPGKGNSEFPD